MKRMVKENKDNGAERTTVKSKERDNTIEEI